MCKKVLKSYDFIIKSSDLFGLDCLFWIVVFFGFEVFTDEFEVIAKLILKKCHEKNFWNPYSKNVLEKYFHQNHCLGKQKPNECMHHS